MKITVRYWELYTNLEPNYNRRHERFFKGKSARECMWEISNFKMQHDLSRYTSAEIINVED